MRIIKRQPLIEFGRKYSNAIAPLDLWYRITLRQIWHNFHELKATFGHADLVRVQSGNRVVVFDIGGNKFRLIASVSYPKAKVYVLRVLTHREYDRNQWKDEL